MNRTSLLGSLVLGLAVCTQGFGFELLDRMLGASGCGCEARCCATACCKDKCHRRSRCCDPCGAKGCGAVAPGCVAAAPTCAAPMAPACAAPAAPACGIDPTCAGVPACGIDKGHCGNGCGCKRGCLLDRLFACNKCCRGGCAFGGCNRGCGCGKGHCGKGHCGKGCGCGVAAHGCGAAAPTCAAPMAPACGCDAIAPVKAAPAGHDYFPMPPAPVVDPSAFIPTQRRVVHASTSLVR